MKKLLLTAALGISALFASPVSAQVSVNVNIGTQPSWGPAGYDHVDYYYLPEIESYYYVPTRNFVYLNGNRWTHAKHLPRRYNGYDLHRGRKVVMNSPRPYLQHRTHRSNYSYARYTPAVRQRVIYRDAPRNHYYSNKHSYRNNDHRGNGKHDYRRNDKHNGRGNHGGHGKH
jgi:hypothetical protein